MQRNIEISRHFARNSISSKTTDFWITALAQFCNPIFTASGSSEWPSIVLVFQRPTPADLSKGKEIQIAESEEWSVIYLAPETMGGLPCCFDWFSAIAHSAQFQHGSNNETVKNLTLFSSIINGIMMESRLRISIPRECFQFFNRIKNSITFRP